MSGADKSLLDVKQGDAVALYAQGGRVLQRLQAGRCTATRITVGEKQYTRRGSAVGVPKDSWRGPNEWIEAWREERHSAEIARKRAERRLAQSRAVLADFRWASVTQPQANAILATLQTLGLLESTPTDSLQERP